MANDGLDPLPGYVSPYESVISTSKLTRHYLLSMISSPARNFLNSVLISVDSLHSTEGEPHLNIHPDDVNACGAVDGELVRIFSNRGIM